MCRTHLHTILFLSCLLYLLPSFLRSGAEAYCGERADTLRGASISSSKVLPEVSYSQVAGAELLRTSPTLADALRSFTSLQVKDYGGAGGLKTVNVRSLGSEYTGVFIDGIAVDNSQNMQIDLGRFSPFDYSSVALYAAPRPYALQTAREYASASSVHLVGYSSLQDGGLSARVRLGSMMTARPSVRWSRRFSRGLGATIGASLLSSDGKYPFRERKYRTDPFGHVAGYDTLMTRRNADIVSGNLMARLDGEVPSLEGHWSLAAYVYGSDRGLPGPVVRRASDAAKATDRQEDCNTFLQGTFLFSPPGRLSMSLRFKGNFDYLRYHTDPYRDPQALAADNRYRQWGAYASLSASYALSSELGITAASDVQYALMRSNMRGFVNPDRLSLWEAVGVRYSPDTAFDLSADVLYCMSRDTFSPTSSPGGFAKEDAARHALAPSVVLTFRPRSVPGLSLDAFVRRSFRMPSFNDLYYTLLGNSSLLPEMAWMYDVGFTFGVGTGGGTDVSIRSSLYYNSVTDKIVALPTASLFRWTMYNIGRVGILGLDVNAVLARTLGNAGPTIRCEFGYTLQRARDYTYPDRDTYDGQVPYIPLHSGTATISASWRGWTATLRAMGSSERFSTSVNIPQYRLEPYVLLDAALTKDIPLGGKGSRTLTLSLDLDNLTSSPYHVVPNYPMPPLTVMLQADYSF